MDDPLGRFIDRKYLMQWLLGGGILLLIVSAFIWWTQVYESPYNVYWGMLNSGMEVSSVTKHVSQSANGTDLNQYITLNFGTSNFAHGLTILKNPTSTVTTESIGTLNSDFVRYTGITTSRKSVRGKKLNFSSVLGKWAKAPVTNTSDQSVSAPFFVQTIIGLSGGNLVPMANLPAQDRRNLVRQLHQNVIFSTTFGNVKKEKLNGQSVYTYSVAIEPVAYVAFEKNFAADLGIKSLESIDPNNYQGTKAVNVTFSVAVRSHRLVAIGYLGANHSETYGSYGVLAHVTIPKTTITDAKLQALLGSIR